MLIDNSFASKSPNMLLKSPLILTNGLEKTTINTEHTGRFDSKFSQICKTNTKFGLLYEPMVNIGVKYSRNYCRIMYQSQILPPGPHFIVTLISMANFWSKKNFLLNKNWEWTKSTLEKCSFDYNLHFLTKNKIFLCKHFRFFEVFSNSGTWWQNLRLVHNSTLFSWIFDTHVDPGSAFL